jgi:hypothetical protein
MVSAATEKRSERSVKKALEPQKLVLDFALS